MDGKYSIELFRDGGEGAGIEAVLVRHDSLSTARALYKAAILKHPGRLVMLCDRARVLARSDRPETMPLVDVGELLAAAARHDERGADVLDGPGRWKTPLISQYRSDPYRSSASNP